MIRFSIWLEEKLNFANSHKFTGVHDAINCMKNHGARVINIYKLLLDIEKGEKYSDSVFLGLHRSDRLLNAITSLAGGIPWEYSFNYGIEAPAENTDEFLEEIVNKRKIVFCVQNMVDLVKGYTHSEFQWLASRCNDKTIMNKVTIVLGLYSILSDLDLRNVSDYTNVDTEKLKELLLNWRKNLNNKSSKYGFKSNKPIEAWINQFLNKIVKYNSRPYLAMYMYNNDNIYGVYPGVKPEMLYVRNIQKITPNDMENQFFAARLAKLQEVYPNRELWT